MPACIAFRWRSPVLVEAIRPANVSPIAGLLLCGDWTRTQCLVLMVGKNEPPGVEPGLGQARPCPIHRGRIVRGHVRACIDESLEQHARGRFPHVVRIDSARSRCGRFRSFASCGLARGIRLFPVHWCGVVTQDPSQLRAERQVPELAKEKARARRTAGDRCG